MAPGRARDDVADRQANARAGEREGAPHHGDQQEDELIVSHSVFTLINCIVLRLRHPVSLIVKKQANRECQKPKGSHGMRNELYSPVNWL